jgi:hypothetical protein
MPSRGFRGSACRWRYPTFGAGVAILPIVQHQERAPTVEDTHAEDLGFAFGLLTSAVIGFIVFLVLLKTGPRRGALCLAMGIWASGLVLQPGPSREMMLAVGVTRLTGFISTVIGVGALIYTKWRGELYRFHICTADRPWRQGMGAVQHPDAVELVPPRPDAAVRSMKCPHCGVVYERESV